MLPLSQFHDSLTHVVLRTSRVFQYATRRRVHAQQRQEHGFERNEFIAQFLRQVQSGLQNPVGVVAEIRFSARYFRQMRYFRLQQSLHLLAVYAEFLEDIVGHVSAFIHNTLQQMYRFYGLLSGLLRNVKSLLYGLLRFNSKLIECHVLSPFLFIFLYCFHQIICLIRTQCQTVAIECQSVLNRYASYRPYTCCLSVVEIWFVCRACSEKSLPNACLPYIYSVYLWAEP